MGYVKQVYLPLLEGKGGVNTIPCLSTFTIVEHRELQSTLDYVEI